jgi:cytochrome c
MSINDGLKIEKSGRFSLKVWATALACLSVLFIAHLAVASAEDVAERFNTSCSGCHGADGSNSGLTPVIQGLSATEVKTALSGYRDRTRDGSKKAIMERVVRTLSDEEIKALADHVAGL